MKTIVPLAIATLLALVPLSSTARDWQVARDQSTLKFTASYQGDAFTGQFGNFDATIAYDPDALDAARFDVTVTLGSVDTQSRERDQTLTSSDFFDTRKHPTARFVTTSFERSDDGKVLAHGTLDLHGVKKPVTLKVDFKPTGTGATLDVHTTLNRLDFGLGAGNDWVDIGKTVPVHGHLVLR